MGYYDDDDFWSEEEWEKTTRFERIFIGCFSVALGLATYGLLYLMGVV